MSDLIVVVDDSLTIRDVVKFSLRQAGYEVVCFDSAESAISSLQYRGSRIPGLFLLLLSPGIRDFLIS